MFNKAGSKPSMPSIAGETNGLLKLFTISNHTLYIPVHIANSYEYNPPSNM